MSVKCEQMGAIGERVKRRAENTADWIGQQTQTTGVKLGSGVRGKEE